MTKSPKGGWGSYDGPAAKAALASALPHVLQEGLDLLKEASLDKVPVDSEDLFKSCKTDKQKTGSGVEGVVSYDTDYAVKQHEDLSLNHPKGDLGQEPKYLEYPLQDRKDDILEAWEDALFQHTRIRFTLK